MTRFGHPKGHQIGAKIESKKRHEKRCVKKVLSRTEAARDGSSIGPVSVEYGLRKRRTTNFGVWAPPNLKLKFKDLKT